MEAKQLDQNTWIFDESDVRFFLLTGSERALLIDSGMQTHNARELAESLTALPLFLLNTHADPDHIGSNAQFDRVYMHPAECSNYEDHYDKARAGSTVVPVRDGDVLDLGGRPLRIIHLPGHTPGSIAVLDEKYRRLFSGDPVQDGRIFMFGRQRDLRAYIHSLRRLESLSGQFDLLYPSHGSCPVKPGQIPELAAAAQDILDGKRQGVKEEVFAQPVIAYDVGIATFLCDPK